MQTSLSDWCSTKWFSLVHGNTLVYNACWEDPRIDRRALSLKQNDNILMITSAGCNALDYVLDAPNHIFAVDMNPRQNALLELKLAGIRQLEYTDFFEIFGKGRHPHFRDLYQSYLRSDLSTEAAKIWDRQLHYFQGKRSGSRSGFYFQGAAGLLARGINHYIDLNRLRSPIESLFNASSVEEQDYIYRSVLHKAFWSDLLRWLLQWDALYALMGVPRTQRQQVEQGYEGGMLQFIEDSLEAVFARLPLHDNYFWWLYFTGEYLPSRCPEYLKPGNFIRLKSGLVDRISVHTARITDFLKTAKEEISHFVLLDHMDWLRGRLSHLLQEEWQMLYEAARPNARLIWRSASLDPMFVNDVAIQCQGRYRRLGDILNYETELSDRLQANDRVHTYGSFAIANFAE